MREELIHAAYRRLLGREPESAEVVKRKSARLTTPDEILREFVESQEFRDKTSHPRLFLNRGLRAPRGRIDTNVTEAQREALFARIHTQWTKLGETEPYWSVLTRDDFKQANFDRNAGTFFGSGATDAELVDIFAQRAQVGPPGGTCMEFGCGVGRVTMHLADRFERVIAVDISAGNLALCRRHLMEAGKRNVEFRHLRNLADLAELPAFDFLFSVVVLQHNPPPIIRFILSTLLELIRPGGFALFQVPTNRIDYEFNVETYLESPAPAMDMHCLPMNEIFGLFADVGLRPLEVLMDAFSVAYGSHTFFAMRAD